MDEIAKLTSLVNRLDTLLTRGIAALEALGNLESAEQRERAYNFGGKLMEISFKTLEAGIEILEQQASSNSERPAPKSSTPPTPPPV